MNDKKRVLLVDLANMAIRTAITLPFDPMDEDWGNWKTRIIHNLKELILHLGPTSVVLCQEGKHNWRYEVFEAYKANRKDEKAKKKIDFDSFYPMMDKFFDTMKKYIPTVYQIKVDCAEGDDVIAVLTKNLKEYEVVAFSTDRDFYQLLKYPNYKQYHPTRKEFVEVLNPERYLLEKIIVGDKGDGVPHVKPRVSKGTAVKIVDAGVDEWLEKEGLRDNFERNKKLIDFDEIPMDVQQKILDATRSYDYKKMNGRDFSAFMSETGLNNLFAEMTEYANTFGNLEKIYV